MLWSVLPSFGAKKKADKLDFAYPKTVVKNAGNSLKKAVDNKNYVEALRSLLDLTVAENLFNRENTIKELPHIDATVSAMPSPFSALGYLIEAQIYSEIYASQRMIYDSRTMPEDKDGENPQFWDKSNFQSKIFELTDKALSQKEAACGVSLEKIKSIIEPVEDRDSYSVYDFIVYKTVSLRTPFERSVSVIPFYGNEQGASVSPGSLFEELMQIHRTPSPARTNAILSYSNTLDPSESEKFLWEQINMEGNDASAVPLLLEYYYRFVNDSNRSEFLRVVTDLEKTVTNQKATKVLSDIRKHIVNPSVSLSFPATVQSDYEFPVTAAVENINEFFILLLDCSQIKDDHVEARKINSLKVIDSKKISLTDSLPFSVKKTVAMKVPSPGKYVIIASKTNSPSGILLPDPSSKGILNLLKASDIDVLGLSASRDVTMGQQGCYVVASKNSQPIEGATVVFEQHNFNKPSDTSTAKTDIEGFAGTNLSNCSITARFNGSEARSDIYCNDQKPEKRNLVKLFSSRAVVHPGDSIQFFGIAYSSEQNSAAPLSSKSVTTRLFNANYQPVDSLVLTTDNSGRIFGSFIIPDDGLLGNWQLKSTIDDGNKKDGNYPSNLFFEVAEYKLPSFLVSLEKTEAPSDSISFVGLAATYSGMPVANAEVRYTITYQPDYTYRWMGQQAQSYSSSTDTDLKGNFNITLPISNLDLKKYRGIFRITAAVTDEAGETVESSPLPFWLQNSYHLSANLPNQIEISNDTVDIEVRVTNNIGLPSPAKIEYSLVNGDSRMVEEGEFLSPVLKLATRELPSGQYQINLRIKEESCDTASFQTIFYRESDTYAPVDTCLWVPTSTIVAPANLKKVPVKFGSSIPGQYVLCIATNSDGSVRRQWFKSEGKMSEFLVDAPADNQRCYVTFITYSRHKAYSSTVTIIPEEQKKKLEIRTVTFRNKITSGERENWQFTLLYDGKPVTGNAYALLYDKAMDAIAPLSWNTHIFSPYYPDVLNFRFGWSNRYSNTFNPASINYPSMPGLDIFDFNTYGYPLYSNAGIRFTRSYAAAKMSATTNVSYAVAPSNMSAKMDAKLEMAIEEEIDDAGGTQYAQGAETGGNGNPLLAEDIPLRDIEMPVALFRPDLSFDREGKLSLDFTVPNFNTTWNFILGAYTDRMLSAGLVLETVASKSVMVSMNSPRFLRTGDDALLTATLYNNTAENLIATGIYELFNPVNGEIISRTETDSLQISPAGSRVFSLSVKCPENISALGLRVYGVSDKASDGEETIIPIFPSSQPVVESEPFYLAPGQESCELTLPSFPENASVTFTYCDNPLWEVLTALPPATLPENESLISQLNAFYANCIGRGLISKNDNLREGLRMIVEGETGDSLLVSNLQKNQELKVVDLNNTPWVNNASNENLRLMQLSSLLSDTVAENKIAEGWKKIMKFHNTDGGWSWCAGMKSSEWITQRVLLSGGMLRNCGYLPGLPSINSALESGIRYCDKGIVDDYNKYGKKESESYLRGLWNYLYIRSFYPEVTKKDEFSKIHGKALKAIEKDWKRSDILEKATIAIILWRNGKQNTAAEILASLNEFATIDSNGAHFANLSNTYGSQGALTTTARVLEAFNAISPDDSIVDGLRQWMIVQKQAQEWQQSSLLYAVNALLTTGSSWDGDYPLPDITIGGRSLSVGLFEKLTGACKVNVDLNSLSDYKVSIKRLSPSQAWGGIVSQFIAPMNEIKSDAIEELSVEKSYLKIEQQDGRDVTVDTGDLKVGDKIRITVSIDCGRDMNYVVLTDNRAACLEPAEQLSGYTFIDGLPCYREIRNAATNIFFPNLPKGRHVITYDCYVTRSGSFSSGIATVQCLYSPLMVAHSAGAIIPIQAVRD